MNKNPRMMRGSHRKMKKMRMMMTMVVMEMRTMMMSLRKKTRRRKKRKKRRNSTLRTSSRLSYQYSCLSGVEIQRLLLTWLKLGISALRTKRRVSFLRASDKQSSSLQIRILRITHHLLRKLVQREKSLITSKQKLEMILNSIG